MKPILCVVCISLFAARAFAGEVEDNFKKFEASVQKAEEQAKAGGKEVNSLAPDIQSIREAIASNNLNAAIDCLGRFNFTNAERRGIKFDEQQKKSLFELLASLQKEQEVQDKTILAPINTAVDEASAAVKKAKSAADLDAALEGLEKVRLPEAELNMALSKMSESARARYQSSRQISFFVSQYQEYLAAKAGGYDQHAREIARNLADFPDRLLPRSAILAKAYEPKTSEPTKVPSPGGKDQ